MAPLAVVTALLAYYLPLFGLPLACFLLGDLTVAQVRRRRRTRAEARAETPKEMAR